MAAGTDGHAEMRGRAPLLGEQARAVAGALNSPPLSPTLLAAATRSVEFGALLLIGLGLRHWMSNGLAGAGWAGWTAVIAAPLLTVTLAHAVGSYRPDALRDAVGPLGRLLGIWTGVILLIAAAGFLLGIGDDGAPRWLLAYGLTGLVFLVAERAVLARLAARWTRQGRLDRRAVIVGGGEEAAALLAALAGGSQDIRICGIFDDRGIDRSPEPSDGPPRLGTVAELVAFARVARIDLLIVALPPTAETRLLEILKELWVLPVDIRLSALGSRLRFRPRAYSFIGTIPFLDLADRPISGWDALVKRSFDIVVATIAIILLSPLMIAAAAAVRLDSPGPILFRQKRYGFNNEVISVLKFRSMYHHLSDPQAKVAVSRGDPRVTRVGRFIRRASIDELPQLFNVLAGTLSIVGPRPHAVNAHTGQRLWDEVVDGYFARHRVKPGITGWAQINGWRGEIDTPEKIQRRVEFDLEYIDRWSILFDLYIVAMTPLSLLQGENAF